MSNAKPSGAPAGTKGHGIIIRLHSCHHPPLFRRDYYWAPLPSTNPRESTRGVKSNDSIALGSASESRSIFPSLNIARPCKVDQLAFGDARRRLRNDRGRSEPRAFLADRLHPLDVLSENSVTVMEREGLRRAHKGDALEWFVVVLQRAENGGFAPECGECSTGTCCRVPSCPSSICAVSAHGYMEIIATQSRLHPSLPLARAATHLDLTGHSRSHRSTTTTTTMHRAKKRRKKGITRSLIIAATR